MTREVHAIIILLIAIDGVGGQIAAGIQLLDPDGFAAVFHDVDGDRAVDGATGVVAAEHALQRRTVGDVEHDVGIDV